MRKARIGAVTLIMVLAMAACSLPGTATEAPPQMQTAAALTVQAVLEGTPLATLAPQASPTSGLPPTTAPSATSAAESAKLTVEDVTNCRSGPGSGYDRITQIQANQQVPIVGSYPSYWLVQSEAGVCWIAMEFSTPAGDIARVPTVTAPATPGAGAPKAPSIQRYDFSCTGGGRAELSIRWTDKSANEVGYRIYMNGEVLIELPADSTQYSGSVLLPNGQNAAFNIEAFNETGMASSSVFTISC